MSILTDKIRTKYPGAYDDMNDQTLEQKILAKYPQYQDLATPQPKTVGGFINNIPKSAGNFVTGMADSVRNIFNTDPNKNTLLQTGKLVNDAILAGGNLITGKPIEQDNSAARLVQHYKDKYVNHLGDTLYTDPVGSAMDVATVLSGTGGVLKGAGSALESSRLASLGNTLVKASEFVDPIQATGKVTGLAGQGINSVLRKNVAPALETASENVVTHGLGNPAKQITKTNESFAGFMKRNNLLDRSPETATALKQSLLDQYDQLALHSGNQVSLAPLIKSIDEQIQPLIESSKYFDADKAKLSELLRRKEQILEYVGAQPNSTPIAGVDQLTEFRRGLDRDIPQSMFGLDPKGSGTAQAAKSTRNVLRESINSSDPRLEQIGMDIGTAKNAEKIFSDYQRRVNNRQNLNLADASRSVVGTLGGLALKGNVGAVIGSIALPVFSNLVNSPSGIALKSNVMSGISRLSESGLPALPKTVSNAFKTVYPAARSSYLSSSKLKNQKSTEVESLLGVQEMRQGQGERSEKGFQPYPTSIPPQSNFSSLLPTPKTSINTNLPTQPTESPIQKKRIGSVNIGSNGKPIMPNSIKYFSSFVK